MAENRIPPSDTVAGAASAAPAAAPTVNPRPPRGPPAWQIYKQPAPFRVFPFPALTNNPISLLHLALTWLGQVLFPPAVEPSVVHTAFWDNDSRAIVVTDDKSMTDLWQQGFYGKGSLSRSEPNWLKRENIRQGASQGRVSEVVTNKRREERMRLKWERARAEQEAIDQRRLDEAHVMGVTPDDEAPLVDVIPEIEVRPKDPVDTPTRPPVGPLELLALPNSQADLLASLLGHVTAILPPVGPLELLALPNSQADLLSSLRGHGTSSVQSTASTDASLDGSGFSGNEDADTNTTNSSDSTLLQRRKSVRFSPKVESTVFQRTDPPSPPHSIASTLKENPALESPALDATGPDNSAPVSVGDEVSPEVPVEVVVVNKEHLQLSPEEAFFLAFSLGALKVVDSSTGIQLATKQLLTLFRQNSYRPPLMSPELLQPDDPFLIQFAVYHHFRSLGWVPRAGIKFGVDWLLYIRGPVFDHAEYGVLVLPSYSDPYWKKCGRKAPGRSWHWLMGVNRVLSKVFKSLVLVYVEIPPPTVFDSSSEPVDGVPDLLSHYKIREQMIKRWSSNRNR